jgi:hypothetical protein
VPGLCKISSPLCLAKAETRRYKPPSQVGVWLSPVEHCVRDAGVAGSNPATPTIIFCADIFRVGIIRLKIRMMAAAPLPELLDGRGKPPLRQWVVPLLH